MCFLIGTIILLRPAVIVGCGLREWADQAQRQRYITVKEKSHDTANRRNWSSQSNDAQAYVEGKSLYAPCSRDSLGRDPILTGLRTRDFTRRGNRSGPAAGKESVLGQDVGNDDFKSTKTARKLPHLRPKGTSRHLACMSGDVICQVASSRLTWVQPRKAD